MFDRTTLPGLAIAGLFLTAPATLCHAGVPAGKNVHLALLTDAGDKVKPDMKEDAEEEKDEKHEGKDEHEANEKHEKKIETAVPMNMVPQAVLDAVKKEVPNGTITESELEVKHGKIMYGFDVKDGAMTYDVNITVDGKFFSKKVDDENDEKDEHDEKDEKKSAAPKV